MTSKLGPFVYRPTNAPAIQFYISNPSMLDVNYIKVEAQARDKWVLMDLSILFGNMTVGYDDSADKRSFGESYLDCTKIIRVDSELLKNVLKKTTLTMSDVNRCIGLHRALTGIRAGLERLLEDISPIEDDEFTAGSMAEFDESCQDSRIDASRILEQQGMNDSGLDQLVNPNLYLKRDENSFRVVNDPHRLS